MFTDGESVAVFGRFTYESTVLSKSVTSPFSVFAKVRNGRCTYMQFMEGTFATAASFRSGGSWTFQSDPEGTEGISTEFGEVLSFDYLNQETHQPIVEAQTEK